MDPFLESCAKWMAGIFIGFALTANFYEFRKFAAAKTAPVKFSIRYAIPAMLLPLLYLCLPFIAIYRRIVEIILSMKYGSKFGGLLNGVEAAIHMQRQIVQILLVVQYKSNSSRSFSAAVEESLRKTLLTEFRKNPKSFGTIQGSFGYTYVLKDEVAFEDCFKTLKKVDAPTDEITKADLNRLMTEATDMPLAKNSKSFWDVLVGTQPVKWKTNTQYLSIQYYPIVFRFDHALTDAAHFFKAVYGLFSDKEVMEYKNPDISKLKQNQPNSESGSKFKYYLERCFAAIVAPAIIYVHFLLAEDLQNTTLKNQFARCFRIEESPHYIPTVKRLRKKFPGSSFEDIMFTTFAASFSECYKKNSKPIPEYLVVPTARESNAKEILESPSKGRENACTNSAVFRLCKLPIRIASEGTYTSLVNTLELITKERLLSENTAEIMVAKFLGEVVMDLMPTFVSSIPMKEVEKSPFVFSSMPGPPYFTVMEGCPIEDVAIVTNGPGRVNGAVFLSYGDRQQIGMVIEKDLTADQNEIQDLIDRMYKTIDLLDKTMI